MPDTATDKYDLTKPQVEGSQDTWGDKLNQDLDEIDALLFNRVVKAAIGKEVEDGASEPENPQVMELALQLPGQAPVPAGTDEFHTDNIAATLAWVEYRIISLLNRMFPVGTIMLWSGSIDSTVTLNHLGWVLCNGSSGSPNLNDRIVLAAGGQHPAGEFGGATGPGLGRHVHAGTATVDAGEAAGPDFTNDFNGAAHFEPSVSNDLPYYTVCYIFKYRDFTVSG